MPYVTPTELPLGFVCRPLRIPNSPQWLAIVSGAILELTKTHNFEQINGLSPDEVTVVFQDMFNEYIFSDCSDMASPLIGEIRMFAYNKTDGDGWLVCDGRAVSREQYPELFAVLGTVWGAGDGSTTFNIPSSGYRFPLGAEGFSPVGTYAGQSSITLTQANLPANTIISGGSVAGQSGLPNPITRKTSAATGIDITNPFFAVRYMIYAGGV